MVFENNTTIEYNDDTPDGDDGDGAEEDDIATESSSNDENFVLIIRYLLYLIMDHFCRCTLNSVDIRIGVRGKWKPLKLIILMTSVEKNSWNVRGFLVY